MDKKLTDLEIVKALKDLVKCNNNEIDCDNCSLSVFYPRCPEEISELSLDLINRLQAENKRLKAPTTDWLVKGISKEQLQEEKIQAFTEEINRLQEENKEWKRVVETWQELHEKDKAEIERLRKAIEKTDCAYFKKSCELDNLIYDFGLLKQERSVAKAEAYKEFAEKVKILNQNNLILWNEQLDNLLKELKGE